ncbi:polysaccharide lyase 8 family protein [Promicromonospora sp. CA-289599]|uniref:polysaccharide lyase 8 family protein n=1 Tax=Promicromonospora sp. CA-289599 TaxID=3240014 RepID=UPI003D8B3B4D
MQDIARQPAGRQVFGLTRRQAIRVGILGAAGAVLVAAGGPALLDLIEPSGTFALMRRRWREHITGDTFMGSQFPEAAEALSRTTEQAERAFGGLRLTDTGEALWSDLPLGGTTEQRLVNVRSSYARLRSIAAAYATRGSSLEADAGVRTDLVAALDQLHAHHYNSSLNTEGNWWEWQIGIPIQLTATSLLLFDDLGAQRLDRFMTAVDKFCPSPAGKGTNRVWSARVVAERSILGEDPEKLASARTQALPALRYVVDGDGMRQDGSFLHHQHAYTGAYGVSLVASTASLISLFHQSPWQFTQAEIADVLDWTESGLVPWLHRGALLAPVRGRTIARPGATDLSAGIQATQALLLLAPLVDAERRARFESVARYMLDSNPAAYLDGGEGLAASGRMQQLLDAGAAARPPEGGTTIFAQMDRIVHRTTDFTLAVALSSGRTTAYDASNGENRHGWYTSCGAHYLYLTGSEFDESFWPTVDMTRLPGSTVPEGIPENRARAGDVSEAYWAGGASHGSTGAVGMNLRIPATDAQRAVAGRKSWFFFGNEVAMLGTGIRSWSGQRVETIVENRRIADPTTQKLTVSATEIGSGSLMRVPDARWAYLSGPPGQAGIGYVFPNGPLLTAQRERRSGRWADANPHPAHRDETEHENEYATISVSHGAAPQGSSYFFVLLPGQGLEDVQRYAAAPEVQVLTSTDQVHAVRRKDATAANFWTAGTSVEAGITCDSPASVVVISSGRTRTIAVADPTQSLDRPLRLTLTGQTAVTVQAGPYATVESTGPDLTLAVDLNRTAPGSTVKVTFEV